MKTQALTGFALIGFLFIQTSASAAVKWRGDFETGDSSQYYATQMVSADRLAYVTSPVKQGKYALKATVKKGDDPINASGNRNELVYKGYEKVGSEYWYKWSTMFAADYPIVNAWGVFAQWHQDADCCGSPPVSFYTYGNEIRLQAGGGTEHVLWTAPLARGVWHEFVFHVKWSPDPKVGFVELFYHSEPVLKKTFAATQQAGDLNYFKIGLYRDESISATGVVFHDDVVMGTALADVKPGVTSTPTPTTPAPTTPVTPAPDPTNVPSTPAVSGVAGVELPEGELTDESATISPYGSSDGISHDEGTAISGSRITAQTMGCSQSDSANVALTWGVGLLALAMISQRRRRTRVRVPVKASRSRTRR